MTTRIWAHRGASAYAPENTLDAFEKAIEMNADGVELDVHLSADGEIIVCHDSNLCRTVGLDREIRTMTLSEIKAVVACATFGDAFPNARIPTLEEVYDLLFPTGLTVNVEIKSKEPELFRKLYELSVRTKMRDRVLYSSFAMRTLTGMQELDACARVAPLYGDNIVKPWCYAESFHAAALHPNERHVHELGVEYILEAHARGIMVNPWTVNDEANMRTLIDLGCDALITNYPDVARGRVLEASR